MLSTSLMKTESDSQFQRGDRGTWVLNEFRNPLPLSELKPDTFVHLDGEMKLLSQLSLIGAGILICGGCTSVFDFSKGLFNPDLIEAHLTYPQIYYVDHNKKLHTCMRFELFFSTQSVRDKFIKSLPNSAHVYPNKIHSYYSDTQIKATILTKSRESYIEVINKMLEFPEARLKADQILNDRYFGFDSKVFVNDIPSLDEASHAINNASTISSNLIHSITSSSTSTPEITCVQPIEASIEIAQLHPSRSSSPESVDRKVHPNDSTQDLVLVQALIAVQPDKAHAEIASLHLDEPCSSELVSLHIRNLEPDTELTVPEPCKKTTELAPLLCDTHSLDITSDDNGNLKGRLIKHSIFTTIRNKTSDDYRASRSSQRLPTNQETLMTKCIGCCFLL
ncbi:hypothetical protein [Legionella worsleiensis]|uniref:Uncharacterized protein n=1 Tax=Legionella worsleiensis TaxID=45076 RepID=A0A0W1A6F6_9GAMM|nr:hypothetical protein [Legionella worsleiensis]KTD76840.1 hypothetical protein Lwor_2065 [Legionella worsleiensis]STY33479.1 Uncharacterised protein [Legionella worsleiensis]